ncbi:MAG: HlyD family type I secretion periplasmic adaptor subunit [Rhizobiaceae bacterium]|nr:HlyD family type I secretion periplasmic adaptor subunit [Rhizobiaceae bacterium]
MTSTAIKSSLRKHMLVCSGVVGLLVGGIGSWAILTEISGAVVASGNVVVETNTRQVQHQEGGIVQSIFVKNGDVISAGDLLIRLDDTITAANLSVVIKQLINLYAQEARLIAEQGGADQVVFTPNDFDENEQSDVRDSQVKLFNARKNSLNGKRQQLREQIIQFESKISGLEAQRQAKIAESKIVEDELSNLDDLLDQQLVSASRVTLLNRDIVKLKGEIGGFTSEIAQTKEAISERNIQILQLDEEFLASVLQEIQDVRGQIGNLEEQKIAAEDQLRRVDIIAPLDGFVHNLAVTTIGGVLGPRDVAMSIVPKDDLLVVEAQVQPINIDQISPEQSARIRLPSFDQRTTPELSAKVETISADLLRDEATGVQYYKVRLKIPEAELNKLEGKSLVPGMPVETFIQTDERTVMSYLLKPIRDQISHAMRER